MNIFWAKMLLFGSGPFCGVRFRPFRAAVWISFGCTKNLEAAWGHFSPPLVVVLASFYAFRFKILIFFSVSFWARKILSREIRRGRADTLTFFPSSIEKSSDRRHCGIIVHPSSGRPTSCLLARNVGCATAKYAAAVKITKMLIANYSIHTK